MRNQENTRRAGQTLLLFTFAIIPIFGMLGLVVDIGWTYYRKEVARSASDAAANAAATAAYAAAAGSNITCSTSGVACYATDYTCPATMPTGTLSNIDIGCLYANENGFSSTGTQTVKFRSGVGNAPGFSGLAVGYWVAATVSEDVPQSFSRVMGFPTASIKAQSVTGAQNPAGGAGGCIFAIGTTGSATLSLTGSSTLTSGCGVYVNSNSSTALNVTGSSWITTSGGTRTRVVGGANITGSSFVTPSAITASPAVGDPWASMTEPTVGACTDNNAGIRLSGSTTQTINPGVICGGISVIGDSRLNLNPGTYIVKNGITISNSSRFIGSGVTIYLVSGGFTGSGSVTITLSGPTSGTYRGVTYFQARTNASSVSITGSTLQNINGLIYLPAGAITYTGSSGANPASTTIVAKTITLTGSSYIKEPAITAFTPNTGGTVVMQ